MRYDLIVLLILLLCIAASDYKKPYDSGRLYSGWDRIQDCVFNFFKSYTEILKSLGSALLIFVPL